LSKLPSRQSTSCPEERWSDEDRHALDEKIDRALEQVAAGKVYGPEEARQKLAAMREFRRADRS
jgi:hypothetical protein